MKGDDALPPLALYVHFPWCVRKCPYCDFNSHARDDELPEQAYVDTLLRDLDAELALRGDARPLTSIFFGGGTPSLFSSREIARLLAGVRSRIALAHDVEITLEANPGTVDHERFAGYHDAGVNRLSIGVQSFAPRHLRTLGRIHDAQDAEAAIASARRAGFARFNVDLMHGLPGQTVAEAVADIERAAAAGAPHVSWYQLTIERNTAFYRSPPTLPDEDVLEAIESAGARLLGSHGFARYEVSAWARDGQAARHNLNYWTFGDYLAIGAGAHGKSTRITANGFEVLRYHKTRRPEDYLADPSRRDARRLTRAELPGEFMLNVLRLRDGVDEALFTARTGLALDAIAAPIAMLRARGLMAADRLATTDLGFRFLDDIVAAFLDEERLLSGD